MRRAMARRIRRQPSPARPSDPPDSVSVGGSVTPAPPGVPVAPPTPPVGASVGAETGELSADDRPAQVVDVAFAVLALDQAVRVPDAGDGSVGVSSTRIGSLPG